MAGNLLVDIRHRLSRLSLRARIELGQESLALVGPSGAGKSSLLKAIAGLIRPEAGRISFRDEAWFDAATGLHVPPEGRGVGVVFQDLALFPHLSVLDNVAFGCSAGRSGRGTGGPPPSRSDRRRKAAGMLERFGLEHLARARPRALSGGEAQRVAVTRAVAADPVVLLLDEPLSALDPQTKARVSVELWNHLKDFALPTIVVSHDFSDVVGLAERVAVMEDGRIVQAGESHSLLEGPVTPFVAALTGVNFFPGVATPRGDLTEIRSTEGSAVFLSTEPATGPVGVVVFPWDVALSGRAPEGSALNRLGGPVRRVVGVGNRVRITVGSVPTVVAELTDESLHRLGIAPGVDVVASWKATGTRLVPRPG
jgi:ABC-type sulfate/molybdate transport systems ATPase subunit